MVVTRAACVILRTARRAGRQRIAAAAQVDIAAPFCEAISLADRRSTDYADATPARDRSTAGLPFAVRFAGCTGLIEETAAAAALIGPVADAWQATPDLHRAGPIGARESAMVLGCRSGAYRPTS